MTQWACLETEMLCLENQHVREKIRLRPERFMFRFLLSHNRTSNVTLGQSLSDFGPHLLNRIVVKTKQRQKE